MTADFAAFFDPDWYCARFPHEARPNITPYMHYVYVGARLGHDPNPFFDARWYLEQNPDVAASGLDPVIHFMAYGARERRDPGPWFWMDHYISRNPDVETTGTNPLLHFLNTPIGERTEASPLWGLFDRTWYVSRHPEIAATRLDPLAHFICFNVERGLDPNPWFDTKWYLTQNPDVAKIGVSPVCHYFIRGVEQGRNPNRWFDTAWYLAQNPDVARSGMNPLVHYIQNGRAEGRAAGPNFDARWYVAQNSDIAATGMNPLAHFLEYGIAEGRPPRKSGAGSPRFLRVAAREHLGHVSNHFDTTLPSALNIHINDLLPAKERANAATIVAQVDVVIPVYRGLEETRDCIASVLRSRDLNKSFGRLILIDDCVVEENLREYLSGVAVDDCVLLLTNRINTGFVASVNRGMAAAGSSDVVLLNSDTVVHGNWLDRLVAHADENPAIGTVTPFSNNATICSYPSIGGSPDMPASVTLAALDSAFAQANVGRAIDLPTGVGFCMLARRACLADVGDFDEKTFGKGYGEEVDFCLRASRRGWRHLLAADVFVFHRSETSFGDTAEERKAVAAALLRDRYSSYEADVARWVQRDPAKASRMTATAALWRQSGLPVVLQILHTQGGGTEKRVAELIEQRSEAGSHLVLMVAADIAGLSFSLLIPENRGYRSYEFTAARLTDVVPILASFGISRVHVHHFIDCLDQISTFLRRLGVPYDVSVHDYAAICPRINLTNSEFEYCGEPDESGCLACLSEGGFKKSRDILWWRELGKSLLAGAREVYCPSIDVAMRIATYVPEANLVLSPHEPDLYRPGLDPVPRPLAPGQPLRVAVLGVMAEHKGGGYLLDCVAIARQIEQVIEWRVIGEFPPPLDDRARLMGDVLSATGHYDISTLQELIARAEPHLILFPQRWPETYSYTLGEAFAARVPVLAPDIGAFSERTAGMAWCWNYSPEISPERLVEKLCELRAQFERAEPCGQ